MVIYNSMICKSSFTKFLLISCRITYPQKYGKTSVSHKECGENLYVLPVPYNREKNI